ncbi:MAG: hypothetical protein HOP18_23295, partial [Deltaproteobacteria bacterium]|nr:hypothetical protein [Deltaproteobacteria bacterium]
ELCRQVGETPHFFRVLRGLWVSAVVRAEYQTARELAGQCLVFAQRAEDPLLLLEARLALGQLLYYLGELTRARKHLEESIPLDVVGQHRSYAFQSSVLFCRQFAAFVLWRLGYPDQAAVRIHEALSLAQELADPFNSAFTVASAAQLHQYRREGRAAQKQAEAAVTLATEQEFALPLTIGTMIQGWALAVYGHGEEGIAQLQEGLAAYQATGAKILLPYFLALLAEAYGKVGQTDKGLGVLAEALAMAEKTGERWHEAELYRLKGELTLQQENQKSKIETDPRSLTPDPQGEAEACFLKAIEIAQKQQAKSLELRATVSLARLWQQQGKTTEAHSLLSDIYHWFTEGFDTKDWQEAKALIEALRH